MLPIATIQIGKNGVPSNLVEILQDHFKTHQNVKVVFLKTSFRDKKKIKTAVEEIINELGPNYTYMIIGFTAMIKKWRKPMR